MAELRWHERAALGLYGLLMRAARPLLRRKLARRARQEPGYAEAVPERFGRYTQPPAAPGQWVWVHAVSLGETRAAAVLVKAWRQQQPGLRLLLTHGTATGRAEGRALLQPGDVQVWQPWDDPGAVARFFAHFQPRLGVLMETEIWPGLLAGARQARVPVVLANARLSERSMRQAQRLAPLARPAYASLHAALAQTQADAQRLQRLGAPAAPVLGNLKFDARPDAAQQALGQALKARVGRPVLVLASSREGEEEAFAAQLQARRDWPFQPLIVPRHPQRFDEVAQRLQAAGWQVHRRSQWGTDMAGLPAPAPGSVWLGDSLGEMALYYSLADLALLGGSFAPLGGQNLIEAAACGCPLLLGPHTFNFSEAAEQALAEGAALRVPDLAAALAQAQALCATPAQARMAQAALGFAARHRGAAQATVAALQALRQVPA